MELAEIWGFAHKAVLVEEEVVAKHCSYQSFGMGQVLAKALDERRLYNAISKTYIIHLYILKALTSKFILYNQFRY